MTVEEILAALQAIIDSANGQPLDDAAAQRYEELEGELQRAQRNAAIVARNAAYNASRGVPAVVNPGNGGNPDREFVIRAFGALLRTGRTDGVDHETGRPYGNVIARAQSEGVGSAGGYLVPVEFSNKIIEKLKAFGGFGQAAEQLVTSDGRELPYNTNDDTADGTAGITPENALITYGQDLTFAQRKLMAYKYDTAGANSLPLKVSWELLQDSAIDLPTFISKKFAERIQRKLAKDFVVGTGVNEPQGVLHGGLSEATAWSSNTTPTYADFVNFIHSLDPAYREGASWAFNDATLALVEKLVDLDGRPLIWNAGSDLSNGPGKTLLGYPIVVDQAFPNPSSGNDFGFFGNISQTYVVRRVKDFTLVTLNELYAQNGQVGYLGWGRWDGMVQDVNAGVLLKAA